MTIYINIKIRGELEEKLRENKLFMANHSKYAEEALRQRLERGD